MPEEAPTFAVPQRRKRDPPVPEGVEHRIRREKVVHKVLEEEEAVVRRDRGVVVHRVLLEVAVAVHRVQVDRRVLREEVVHKEEDVVHREEAAHRD